MYLGAQNIQFCIKQIVMVKVTVKSFGKGEAVFD